ncbi:MAG: hypothetical protein V4480_01755 [Patescibacteria group bacterium]
MDILKPKSIEEMVISLLRQGPLSNAELLASVRIQRGVLTKQGFYAALRKLKKEEIVVVYKKITALNASWIERMQRLVETMRDSYVGSDQARITDLADRESVSYVFLNIRHLDVFWGHAQNLLISAAPKGAALLAYDPHYWFYIARKETEQELLKQVVSSGRQFLMTVGGNTKLDRSIKADFKTDMQQYHINRAFERNTYYVTVIGDFILEVYLDASVARTVEDIYALGSVDAETKLVDLLTRRSRNRLRISRNYARAEQIRTRLSKHFYIKNEA